MSTALRESPSFRTGAADRATDIAVHHRPVRRHGGEV